jgi:hypothetical protein
MGDGPSSDIISVFTASTPTGLAAPSSIYVANLEATVIQWLPATDDGGLPPLSYTL